MPANHGTARKDENVVAFNLGCDLSVIGGGWKVLTQCNCDDKAATVGAGLAQMSSTELPLASAAAKIVRPSSEPPLITAVHQALCDDNLQQNKTVLNSNAM